MDGPLPGSTIPCKQFVTRDRANLALHEVKLFLRWRRNPQFKRLATSTIDSSQFVMANGTYATSCCRSISLTQVLNATLNEGKWPLRSAIRFAVKRTARASRQATTCSRRSEDRHSSQVSR